MLIDRVELYWILKLDDIFCGLMILAVIAFAVALATLIIKERMNNMSSIFIVASLLSLIALTLMPSTKQMATILVLPSIINNEQVQQLPQEIIDLSMDWLEELRPHGGSGE